MPRIKNADTKGELLVEAALISAGGSLLEFDNRGMTVNGSLEGKFIYEKQARLAADETRFVFDFVIYADKMIVIEYDGGFHFKPTYIQGDILSKFKERHDRDLRKDEFCEDIGIPFLRIRYDQDEQIEEMVKDVLSNPDKYIRNHNYEGPEYYDEWKWNFEQLMKGIEKCSQQST